MTDTNETHVEPTASASPADRRRFVSLIVLFLAGPTIWITHFMVVYLLAEAVCTTDLTTHVFGLHVVSTVTLIATAVAVAATAYVGVLALRRSHRDQSSGEPDGPLAFAGFLLSALFGLAILFVGVPAFVLDAC